MTTTHLTTDELREELEAVNTKIVHMLGNGSEESPDYDFFITTAQFLRKALDFS